MPLFGQYIATRPYMNLPLKSDTNDKSINAQNPANTGVVTTTGIFGESNGAYEWELADYLSWASGVGNSVATKLNANGTFLYFINYSAINAGSGTPSRVLGQFDVTGNNIAFAQIIYDSPAPYVNAFSIFSSDNNSTTGYSETKVNSVAVINTWQFVTFTLRSTSGSNNEIKIYKDSVLKATGSTNEKISENNTIALRLGAVVNQSASFQGKMADFRIYAKTLTQGEIAVLNQQKGRIKC